MSCCLSVWLVHTTAPVIKNAARAEIDSCVNLGSMAIGSSEKLTNVRRNLRGETYSARVVNVTVYRAASV